MTEILLGIVICLVLVILVLLIISLRRRLVSDFSPLQIHFDSLEKNHERTERLLRDDMAKNREEASSNAHQAREEISNTLRTFRRIVTHADDSYRESSEESARYFLRTTGKVNREQ